MQHCLDELIRRCQHLRAKPLQGDDEFQTGLPENLGERLTAVVGDEKLSAVFDA